MKSIEKLRKITRRDLFKIGGVVALSSAIYGLCYTNKTEHWNPKSYKGKIKTKDYSVPLDGKIKVVVVKNGEPKNLIREAISKFGGIEKFVKPTERVAIKPNIGWDRTPIMAANTNPELVGEVVRLCKDAGAKEVIVGDVSCNEPRRSYQRSGILESVIKAGGKIVYPEERYMDEINIGGEILSKFPLFRELLEVDKIINIAIAKHHTLAGYTGVMKNWYGIVGGNRSSLHQNLPLSIVEFVKFINPTLSIVDGYRVLIRNGPQGGSLSDTLLQRTIIVGVDQVAVDIEGAKLIGKDPFDLPYIELALTMGLGKKELKEDEKLTVILD